MKTLQKKMVMLFLSFSNLAVLGLVFHTYFASQQSLFLFSSSEDLEDLHQKISQECEDELQALKEGERNSFTCSIRVNQKQKEASYILRTKVIVEKQSDGSFAIRGQGAMRDKKQHATEADFCNDCSTETSTVSQSGTLVEIINQVKDMAGKFYTEAQDSVRKARKEYNEKDREKRMAHIKEKKCQGRWDDTDESFEEFELEERLDCKMNQISELGLPLEIEKFYHKNLKKELWDIAISDDDYLLKDSELLDKLSDPYRYPLSVRASSSLVKLYLNDWKDDYDILDTTNEKINFLKGLQNNVSHITSVMTPEQSQQDLYYFKQKF